MLRSVRWHTIPAHAEGLRDEGIGLRNSGNAGQGLILLPALGFRGG